MTPKEWDALPEHIKEICGMFDENEDSYQECAKLQDRLQSVGWTCGYYLDGVPFDVKPMNTSVTITIKNGVVQSAIGGSVKVLDFDNDGMDDDTLEKMEDGTLAWVYNVEDSRL
jgi:hypothetical protein